MLIQKNQFKDGPLGPGRFMDIFFNQFFFSDVLYTSEISSLIADVYREDPVIFQRRIS